MRNGASPRAQADFGEIPRPTVKVWMGEDYFLMPSFPGIISWGIFIYGGSAK